MQKSKHTITSAIRGTDKHFAVNLLTGHADILSNQEAELLENLSGDGSQALQDIFIENGYISDDEKEKSAYRNAYFNFLDERDDEEIQLFFVPNYSCNFGCFYCYQDEYTHSGSAATPEVVHAFFDYILKEFATRKKYITIFGGEPLLQTPRQREIIELVMRLSAAHGLEVSVVTNGYWLEEYIDILKSGRIREVQVTLDGIASVHDKRRSLKGGQPTFEKIVGGIDAALAAGFSINLRMVADRDNLDTIVDLASFAIEKGWTTHPLFKTQLGRNYELHHCQSTPDKLFTRLSLYERIFELTKEYPHLAEFYKPSYSVVKHLREQGKLPDPLFDACPACKSEWAFDYTGSIYSCTATVGKEEEKLGTFYPEVTRNESAIREWSDRDVTSIPECAECSLQLACGGGCGSIAKNKNGSILSPDCRPVKELMELGFAGWMAVEPEEFKNEE